VFNYCVIIIESRPPIRNVFGYRPNFLIISHRSVLVTVVTFVITGQAQFGLNTGRHCEGQNINKVKWMSLGNPLNFTVYQLKHSTFLHSAHTAYFRVLLDLRTNSNYSPKQNYLIDLYNTDGECLLRGTE
jgi:hypothetical protein